VNPETIDTIPTVEQWEQAAEEPTAWTMIAAALRELADRCATLADNPAASGEKDPYTMISFLPGAIGAAPETKGIVDAVGMALLGQPGARTTHDEDGICYRVDGRIGPVWVSIHGTVPVRRSEVEELRAEVAMLRAQVRDGVR
jgi:hypothetical protein